MRSEYEGENVTHTFNGFGQYGVDIRYPGDQPEPNLEEAREAVELARKVRDAILPLLEDAPGSTTT